MCTSKGQLRHHQSAVDIHSYNDTILVKKLTAMNVLYHVLSTKIIEPEPEGKARTLYSIEIFQLFTKTLCMTSNDFLGDIDLHGDIVRKDYCLCQLSDAVIAQFVQAITTKLKLTTIEKTFWRCVMHTTLSRFCSS